MAAPIEEREEGQPAEGSQAQFFWDRAHGVKMMRIARWIVNTGAPMSGKSVHLAMAELGIDEIQPRCEREIHGIVLVLRGEI